MALADHDRFTTLQQQAAPMPEAFRLAAASVVSIMAVATVMADIKAPEVKAGMLVLAATAGKWVA